MGSSPAWRGLPGQDVYPARGSIGTGYYAAPREDLQADQFPWGFSEPGFDDAGWAP